MGKEDEELFNAVQKISRTGAKTPEDLRTVMASYVSDNPLNWVFAELVLLEQFREAAPSALEKSLWGDKWLAWRTLLAIQTLGPDAACLKPSLLRLLETTRDLGVKAYVLEMLPSVFPGEQWLIDCLVEYQDDASSCVAVSAAGTLASMGKGDAERRARIIEQAMDDPDPLARATAARFMGLYPFPSSSAVSKLCSFLHDSDPAVKHQAALSLARLDVRSVADEISQMLQDKESPYNKGLCGEMFPVVNQVPFWRELLKRAVAEEFETQVWLAEARKLGTPEQGGEAFAAKAKEILARRCGQPGLLD